MSNLYTCKAIERLVQLYIDKGGEVAVVEEGCLGYGFLILHGDGLKTAIVKEVYLNDHESAHTIRKYNKCPKKYAKLLEEV